VRCCRRFLGGGIGGGAGLLVVLGGDSNNVGNDVFNMFVSIRERRDLPGAGMRNDPTRVRQSRNGDAPSVRFV
jgi:hypothetical protein